MEIVIDENDELTINEEYEKLLPPLSPDQFKALERSILENGQIEPITANPKRIVIDGVNRLKICRAHDIKPKYVTRKFANELEEMKYIIETNLMRRQLTTFQRIEAALPLIKIERALAEKRKKAGKPLKDLDQNFGQGGRTLEIVADRIGVSDETIRQGLWLIEHATEAQLDKVRRGEKSISRLYQELKNKVEKKWKPKIIYELTKPWKPPNNYRVLVERYPGNSLAKITIDRLPIYEFEECSKVAEEIRGMGIDIERIIVDALEKERRTLRNALRRIAEENKKRARVEERIKKE